MVKVGRFEEEINNMVFIVPAVVVLGIVGFCIYKLYSSYTSKQKAKEEKKAKKMKANDFYKMAENEQFEKKLYKSGDSNNGVFSGAVDNKNSAHIVNDLMMVAEEDPLSLTQAKAYRRELQFAKTFSLLLSEDGINPKDFDEDLEIEYGCKLDDVFKVSISGSGSIKFVIPSNLAEARAMLQAKYQAILKAPLVASGVLREDSKGGADSVDEPSQSSTTAAVGKSVLSDALAGADGQQKKQSSLVKRTYGRTAQNTTTSDDAASPPQKRSVKTAAPAPPASGTSSTEPLSFSSLSEIEAYFYASIKGSQSYTEAKGDYRFECCVCSEIFDENIKTVMHMHSHLGDASGTVATRCSTCYRWFPSEQEMEKHKEQEHSSSGGNACRICDSDYFHDLADLAHHMQTTHVRREMPYACRLCGFRSSLYMDSIDHFFTAHAGSSYAQCAFCLQVYQLKPSATGGPCRTANFFDHISRHHREKETQANCYRCRLSFLGFGDLPRHEKLEHQPGNSLHCVARFTPPASAPSVSQTVAKSGASASVSSKQQEMDLSRLTINLPATSATNGPALCRECAQPMAKKGHFGRYTSCTSEPGCTFASACTFAMANHVARHRRQQQTQPATATAPPLAKPLYCSCGFSSAMGAIMAAHLVSCPSGSRSCSTLPPPASPTSATASSGAVPTASQPQPNSQAV